MKYFKEGNQGEVKGHELTFPPQHIKASNGKQFSSENKLAKDS